MSVDFETRARQAGAGVRSAVGRADLQLSSPPVSGAPIWSWAMAGVGAMAALVLLFVVGTMFRPDVVADDTLITPTTVQSVTTVTEPPATTIPQPVVPIVPEAEPTTTTSTAAPTTTVADTEPPLLEITSPTEGQVFEVKTIDFSGRTEPGAVVMAGPYQATVAPDGSWTIRLILSAGRNRTVFTATDAAGNQSVASVTAVFEAPVTDTTDPKRESFTANATWIECTSTPPFEEYYGTGQPGSWVVATSEYGGGETIVKPDGTWYMKVVFNELPRGKWIVVKVKDQYGRQKNFEFIAREPA